MHDDYVLEKFSSYSLNRKKKILLVFFDALLINKGLEETYTRFYVPSLCSRRELFSYCLRLVESGRNCFEWGESSPLHQNLDVCLSFIPK